MRTLVDSLKKATGVFLNANEQYQRAYEKGVLLGKYDAAAELFTGAAEKARQEGDSRLASRACANAALYECLWRGSREALRNLSAALSSLEVIECIGSQSEFMPTAALRCEVDARLVELDLEQVAKHDYSTRARLHAEAAGWFKNLLNQPLLTHKDSSLVGTGAARFYSHTGHAAWYSAWHVVLADPASAAEHLSRAITAFRQSGEDAARQSAERWLAQCRQLRTCWFCGREVQGAEIHFEHIAATVHPYAVEVVRVAGQDVASLAADPGRVIACRTCKSALEQLAQRAAVAEANAVREEYAQRLQAMERSLADLSARVRQLYAPPQQR